MCSETIVIDHYAKFYNYTLVNAIENKKNRRKMFRNEDLLYIMGSMVDIALILQEKSSQEYWNLFRSDKVFLSTEGFIKVYPFRINIDPKMSEVHSVT